MHDYATIIAPFGAIRQRRQTLLGADQTRYRVSGLVQYELGGLDELKPLIF
jgi:hypothetical protein